MADKERKAAIVTGGAGGLGTAIAKGLVAGGYNVVIADVDEDALTSTAQELSGNAGTVRGIPCDVSDTQNVENLVNETVSAQGRLDALVNCHGIGPLPAFLETTPEIWNRTIAINLTGTFLCCQAAAKVMVGQRSGRIVNIASISGARAGFGRTAYGTSKAGVIHLTKQLAVELGPYGITVNAVGPGPVDTPLTRSNHTPEARADYHAMIPLERYGTPEEIADAVVFLCSEKAQYVNGQTLFVDGGFVAGGVDLRTAQAQARG